MIRAAEPPYLVISRHDYRSAARANIHFLTDELARRGPTRFASIGLSNLSRLGGDPRMSLFANGVEVHRGVECFLWSSVWHPVSLRPSARAIERASFDVYERFLPRTLHNWIDTAGTIVIESGLGVVLTRLAHRRNPQAMLIYNASDDLGTIGAAHTLSERLARDISLFDCVRMPSALLVPMLPFTPNAVVIPQGFDSSLLDDRSPSPYGPGRHAVSIGSMLFDRTVFETACLMFPDVTFHVIGAGRAANGLAAPNLRVYPVMPHAATIPFIRDADLGIAAYRKSDQPAYLADSSMKLIQFAAFGLPSVCPDFATGERPERIGYNPSDLASLPPAIQAALDRGKGRPGVVPSWGTVVDRMVGAQ